MSIAHIWFFVIPFALAAALPGPAQGAMVARVLARRQSSAFAFVLGMIAGNAIWLTAALLGLSALALRYASVFVAVKWIGVAYLLFVAWKLWSAPVDGDQQAPSTAGGGLLAGAILTLGNPKAVVFFGAVLPQAFDMSSLSFPQCALIVVLGLAIDFTVQLVYLFAATRARTLLRQPHHLRKVNRTAATMMAGCAAVVATRS